MRSAVSLWNVVSEAKHVFLEAIVPLHCDFYCNAILLLTAKVEYFLMNSSFLLIQIFNECLDTAFIHEVVFFTITFVF